MKHYIAIIHKDEESAFGASFPYVPGVIASAASLDSVLAEAREALAFAAEDWEALCGSQFPEPRSLDALRSDPLFLEAAAEAVVAAVPLEESAEEAA